MIRVLYIISNVPKYREAYINTLGKSVSLHLIVAPPELDNHVPMVVDPSSHVTIEYCNNVGSKTVSFSLKALRAVLAKEWDVLICGYAPRSLDRWLFSLIAGNRLLWVGHIFGRKNGMLQSLARKLLLRKCGGIIVYDPLTAERLRDEVGIKIPIISFNNSSFSKDQCFNLPIPQITNSLNLLFVGRPQERKRLDRLIMLAERNQFVNVRLVGPNMPEWLAANFGKRPNVEAYPACFDDELRSHMEWSHVVASPGHVGLLVVTAGQYRRPFVFDSASQHAPEVHIAYQTGQFAIDFSDDSEIDTWIENIKVNFEVLDMAADRIFNLVTEDYTAEGMAARVMSMVNAVPICTRDN